MRRLSWILLTASLTSIAMAGIYRNALDWTRSPEREAACRALYTLAGMRLEQALADRSWTALDGPAGADKPPAVVLDLDETVLDNSPFTAWLENQGHGYDAAAEAAWEHWVRDAKALAVPGAREFLQLAEAEGVAILYLTNRTEDQRESTLANLAALGLPAEEAGLAMLGEGDGWDKQARLGGLSSRHRILLLLGDSRGDFPPAAPDDPRWGRQWLCLPNPLYGSWEGTRPDEGGPADWPGPPSP